MSTSSFPLALLTCGDRGVRSRVKRGVGVRHVDDGRKGEWRGSGRASERDGKVFGLTGTVTEFGSSRVSTVVPEGSRLEGGRGRRSALPSW